MSNKRNLFGAPIKPFMVEPNLSGEQILDRMSGISFQGRNLATAHRVWKKMLADDCLIFLGIAGALSAGGLRLILAHLIAHRKFGFK